MPTCMYVYHMCAWCPQRSEESIEFNGIKIINDCNSPWGLWEPNPDTFKSRGSLYLASHSVPVPEKHSQQQKKQKPGQEKPAKSSYLSVRKQAHSLSSFH